MVLNRGLAFARLLQTAKSAAGGVTQQSIRHSGEWVYRAPNVPKRRNVIVAEVLGGVMWWWILWHLFTEPGHIIGEFPFPDTDQWTDEELGIPPDDE